jgi:hypothetical protein
MMVERSRNLKAAKVKRIHAAYKVKVKLSTF